MGKREKRERDAERAKNMKLTSLIRKFDDPVLSQVCEKIVPGDNLEFLKTMRKVCLATGTGVGLAAPQIGIAKCAVYIHPLRSELRFWWMVNPEIIAESDEIEYDIEGCLSYPGYAGSIARKSWIKVKYLEVDIKTLGLTEVIKIFTGWEARIVLHEYDHCLGVCLVASLYKAKLEAPIIQTTSNHTCPHCGYGCGIDGFCSCSKVA